MATPSARAINAAWLQPTSGQWAAAANWSSPAFPDNVAGSLLNTYDVTIAAEGTPYTVTISRGGDVPLSTSTARYIDVDRLTIDSPDATLRVAESSTLTVYNGLHVERGVLLLDDEALLSRARVSTGAGGQVLTGPNRYVWLNDVTLAADLLASSYLSLGGTTTLENATLSFAAGNLYHGAKVLGSGEWRLASGRPSSSNFSYIVNYYDGPDRYVTIGNGVTVRTAGSAVNLYNLSYAWNNGGYVLNQGTIVSEGAGSSLFIEGFRNTGTVIARSGGQFSAQYTGSVGNLQIESGGTVYLYGAPHLNSVVTVGAGATLQVRPEGIATATAAIALETGGALTLSPPGIVPVTSSGGNVYLSRTSARPDYTVNQLTTLPLTGPATVQFSDGGLDLQGTSFNPAALPANFVFNPPRIRSGVLQGASLPVGAQTSLLDVGLEVAGVLPAGKTLTLEGASELRQPMTVAGGLLDLTGSWTNTGGITVESGELRLRSPGAAAGAIDMAGGQLRIVHSMILAQLEALDVGAPALLRVGNGGANFHNATGILDLGGQTLDLRDWPTTQWEVNSGWLRNGVVTSDHNALALNTPSGATIENVTLQNVKVTAGNFSNCTLQNVWASGRPTVSGTVANSRFDAGLTLTGTVQGSFQIGGPLKGQVTFAAGSSVTGSGVFGATEGRGNRDTYNFVDPNVTLPAGIDLPSATQYDSLMVVNAAATNLVVEGDVRVGWSALWLNAISDSLTFNVAQLTTRGDTIVTADGRLVVNGGPWTNAGSFRNAGGQLQAGQVTVPVGGSFGGWGAVTAALAIDGELVNDYAGKTLTLTGSLTLAEETTTRGTLAAAIGAMGSAPLFDVNSAVVVDGDLAVAFAPGYAVERLAVGDRFALIEGGSVSGLFDALTTNLGWVGLTPVYSSDAVLLEVTSLTGAPATFGDANADGLVDAADYVVWRDSLGMDVTPFTLGDFDGSGRVDAADRDLWRRQYGAATEVTAAVPEPAGMLLVASLSLLLNRRR